LFIPLAQIGLLSLPTGLYPVLKTITVDNDTHDGYHNNNTYDDTCHLHSSYFFLLEGCGVEVSFAALASFFFILAVLFV